MAKNITVCIPVYEQKGLGYGYTKRSLDILAEQTYEDFDVVVSDNSTYFAKEKMEALCKQYPFVHYVHNPELGISANTNNAIRHATGKIIKILFQDDYLLGVNALTKIANGFKKGWMVTACEHNVDGKLVKPFTPIYNKYIHLGNNTISSPSVLAFENKDPMFFDEDLEMLMDVDYYKRLYDRYGAPTILKDIVVVNQVGEHQRQFGIPAEDVEAEKEFMKKKYVDNTNL